MESDAGSGRPHHRTRHAGGAESGGATEALAASAWADDRFADEVNLSELEELVIDDDLRLALRGDTTESLERLAADQVLIRALVATGFTGRICDLFQQELARYAIDVLVSWIRCGKIGRVCRDRGRPIDMSALQDMEFSHDDLCELAIETVARALRFFIQRVLKEGGWDPRRGACIKTFFIGACVLEFPNTYRRWVREHRDWTEQADLNADIEAVQDDGRVGGEFDQTADLGLAWRIADDLLGDVKDTKTRSAAYLIGLGFTYSEAGAIVGLSERAVEGRFRRLRMKAGIARGGHRL